MNLPKSIKDRLTTATDIVQDHCDEGRDDMELAKISAFIQCGLFILSIILISGIAIAYGQDRLKERSVATSTRSVATSSGGYSKSQKKLPIYCVDTTEKKVALSFDAAWGDSRLMKRSPFPVSLIRQQTAAPLPVRRIPYQHLRPHRRYLPIKSYF